MNTTILQKCIEELKAELPKLDYLRGMLETLLAVQEIRPLSSNGGAPKPLATAVAGSNPAVASLDEAAILDANARQALKTIEALGGIQTE